MTEFKNGDKVLIEGWKESVVYVGEMPNLLPSMSVVCCDSDRHPWVVPTSSLSYVPEKRKVWVNIISDSSGSEKVFCYLSKESAVEQDYYEGWKVLVRAHEIEYEV